MSTAVERSDLVQQLKQVQEWGQQQEHHWEQKQTELQKTIQQTETELARLQTRLEELKAQQSDLTTQVDKREAEMLKRMRLAISSGLDIGAQTLQTRELLLQKQRKIRDERVQAVLQEPRFQEKIAEYRQFQETQAHLQQLPASYRNVILQHHATVRRELEPIFMAAEQPLPKTDKPAKCIGIIASVEPNFEAPEAMAVFVPVSKDLYFSPTGGDDSLQEILAYRCVGAITSALHKVGLREVSFNFGQYKNYLSIQVWLEGKQPSGDIRQSISLEFQQLRDYAAELQAVRLGVDVTWLDPALLEG